MQNPRAFVSNTIMAHEGGLSTDKDDTGNWFRGVLVGSKYGVTGAALAAYRGVKNISAADMKALARDEAISIALSLYYDKPDMDLLAWNAVTASIVDMGYNAGPSMANKLLQRLIAVADDGKIGDYTATAFGQWIKANGLVQCAEMWCQTRIDYYDQVIAARPTNAKYRDGWRNRARSFLPTTRWWKDFHA